jgi:hypothetical protein
MTINTLYQTQLQYIFNRPVTEPAWYWTPREEEECLFDDSPMQAFEFIENLCKQPKIDLSPYTDDQIALGFNFIFNGSCSNFCHGFKEASVLIERKIAAIHSLFNIFKEVLNERCVADTSAHNQVILSKLNNFCYMFWDESPLYSWLVVNNKMELLASSYGMYSDEEAFTSQTPAEVQEIIQKTHAPYAGKKMTAKEYVANIQAQYDNMDSETRRYYLAICNVMDRCLSLSNPACVESALHGLGHTAFHLPKIAVPIINKYLKTKPKNATLVSYAKDAKTGLIL